MEMQAIGGIRFIRFEVATCSLGSVLVAVSALGICAILLGDDPVALIGDLRDRFPGALIAAGVESESIMAEVVGLIEFPATEVNLPLDLQGTPFQRRVWDALRAIPPGATRTYTELASAIGQPGSVRAVASACGANPLAVAVPCHRVVRSDGSLAGYRWGVERKAALLQRERVFTGVDRPGATASPQLWPGR